MAYGHGWRRSALHEPPHWPSPTARARPPSGDTFGRAFRIPGIRIRAGPPGGRHLSLFRETITLRAGVVLGSRDEDAPHARSMPPGLRA
jgi:hypothetical protein